MTEPQGPRRHRHRRIGPTTYLVVGAAAAVAAYLTPDTPESATQRAFARTEAPPALAVPAAPAPVWQSRVDTLGRGETLVSVLQRAGIARVEAARLLRSVDGLQPRSLRAGLPVTVSGMSSDSLPSEIVLRPAVDRIVRFRYLAGAWQAMTERLAWRTDTIAASGVVTASVYQAVHGALGDRLPASEKSELVYTLADVLEYRVDLAEDVQRGDSVRLVIERRVAPDGSARDARLLAAAVTVDGAPIEAIRFGAGRGQFYDANGKSLRAAFLRAPLEFRRISSGFGMRRHPILGRMKMHQGMDYAASSGTPVRAVGDGVVLRAGWAGGYGNVLEIRHRNGFVTRYGHLRGFARGVRAGRSVGIGQTVAFVGTTGLSTAPHLHFEVLVSGRHRDPRVALRDKAGWPLAGGEKVAFQTLRRRMLATMSGPGGDARLAMAE